MNIKIESRIRHIAISHNPIKVRDSCISGYMETAIRNTPYIRDNVKGDNHAYELKSFADSINLMLQLGDMEHGSDWDPYLKIYLQDENHTIVTESQECYISMDSNFIHIFQFNGTAILYTVPVLDIVRIELHELN